VAAHLRPRLCPAVPVGNQHRAFVCQFRPGISSASTTRCLPDAPPWRSRGRRRSPGLARGVRPGLLVMADHGGETAQERRHWWIGVMRLHGLLRRSGRRRRQTGKRRRHSGLLPVTTLVSDGLLETSVSHTMSRTPTPRCTRDACPIACRDEPLESASDMGKMVGLAGIEPATSALSGPITRSTWNQMITNSQVSSRSAHPWTTWHGSARAIFARCPPNLLTAAARHSWRE